MDTSNPCSDCEDKKETGVMAANPSESPESLPLIRPMFDFPDMPRFPMEGILGMYPIPSACKRDVALHMVQFQQRLRDEYLNPHVTTRISDFRNEDPLDSAYEKIQGEMDELESAVDEVKHQLAVQAIKKKYNKHDVNCPCSSKE
ncbi:hypothetical protein RUM44_013440 [Polyplax serrata]|uniref:Uncharacterized protein n=1 Tax=Polyplax serrata TaxID=468196 RepID=A0ABR1BGE1_POLSC